MFCKKGVLRDFSKLTEKHLCWSFFLMKLQAWGLSFIKKKFQQRCFPVNFARFFRTPILYMIIYVIQNKCSKNLPEFTARLMWTAVSDISEKRLCLAGCNFLCFSELTVSQYLRYWTFPVRCSFQLTSHWWTPSNVLKLMTQHKW